MTVDVDPEELSLMFNIGLNFKITENLQDLLAGLSLIQVWRVAVIVGQGHFASLHEEAGFSISLLSLYQQHIAYTFQKRRLELWTRKR